MLLKSLDNGVEVYWQLRSASSPETLSLSVDLPADAGIARPGPNGTKIVRDGKMIGLISPVVATDADGEPVDTTVAVHDHRVLISVAHHSQDVRYPILVDPTVEADYIFPYDGTTAFAAWYTYAYPASKFALVRSPLDSDPYAWYGNGLYIHNAGYPSTLGFTGGAPASADHAGFYYAAPGQARIFQVDNSDSKNVWGGDPLQMCMIVGIAQPDVANWDGPYGTTWGEGCTPFSSYAWHVRVDPNGSGTPGNTFVFGEYAYTTGNWAFNAYFRDAVIYMDDADNPSVTQVNAPDDEWINGDHTGALRAFATDPSTGVKSVNFSIPGRWSSQATNPNCLYGPCSTPWDNGANQIPVSSLPEGMDTINITAVDPAGNSSPPATISLAIDHTAPPAPALKTAAYDSGSQETHISWAPATDPALVDGNPGSGLAGYEYRYSTNGGTLSDWQTTGAPLFTVPGTTPGQSFHVEVRAVDEAANYGSITTGDLTAAVPSDTTPPTLSLAGDLYDQAGQVAWEGYWDFDASAADAGGSGVAEIRAKVDGAHMTFSGGQTVIGNFEVGVQGQICAEAGCSLTYDDIPFDTQEYSEGAHTVSVTATDFAGNSTTQQFVIINSHSDEPLAASAAQADAPYTVYNAGVRVANLPLTRAVRTRVDTPAGQDDQDSVTYLYGSCDWKRSSCMPPVEVQSSSLNRHNVSVYLRGVAPPAYNARRIKGVPAASFDGGRTLEIYTGNTTISIYGSTAAQVRRVAEALRPSAPADIPTESNPLTHISRRGIAYRRLRPPSSDPTTAHASLRDVEDGNTYKIPWATYRGCRNGVGDRLSDPINVVFIGSHATGGNVRDMIAVHGLKWPDRGPLNGGTAYINDPMNSTCRSQDESNSKGTITKHHVREWSISGTQHGNLVAAANAHRDVKTTKCGGFLGINDTVPASVRYHKRKYSGFDVAQQEFLDAYPDRRAGTQTRPEGYVFTQCDPHSGDQQTIPASRTVQFFWINADY